MVEFVRKWIGIIGVLLAVVVFVITGEQVKDAVRQTNQAACDSQHQVSEKWDQSMDVIRDLSKKYSPTHTVSPVTEELADRTSKVFAHFPACKLVEK